MELGTDPMLGCGISEPEDTNTLDWRNRSPLALAARLLHLDKIRAAVKTSSSDRESKIVEFAQAMAYSSYLERQVIHGKV